MRMIMKSRPPYVPIVMAVMSALAVTAATKMNTTWPPTETPGQSLDGKMFTLSQFGGGISFFSPYYSPTPSPWSSAPDYATDYPTRRPYYPTRRPYYPTRRPYYPTRRPYYPTRRPYYPTRRPYYPTRRPYYPTRRPYYPTRRPYYPTRRPYYPTRRPYYPTRDPYYPTREPSYPSNYPTRDPYYPTREPSYPSNYPTRDPYYPTREPSYPSNYPTRDPYYPTRDPNTTRYPYPTTRDPYTTRYAYPTPPTTTPTRTTRGVSVCLRYLAEELSSFFTLSPSGGSPLQLTAGSAGLYYLTFDPYKYDPTYFRPNLRFWSNMEPDIWTRVCVTVDSMNKVAQMFSGPNISIRKMMPFQYVWSGEPVIDFSGFEGQLTDVQIWDYPLRYKEVFNYMTSGIYAPYRGSVLSWSDISYSPRGKTLLEDTYEWQARRPIGSSRVRKGRRPKGGKKTWAFSNMVESQRELA